MFLLGCDEWKKTRENPAFGLKENEHGNGHCLFELTL